MTHPTEQDREKAIELAARYGSEGVQDVTADAIAQAIADAREQATAAMEPSAEGEYATARWMFGFSASAVVRDIHEDASRAKIAEEVMVACYRAIATVRLQVDEIDTGGKLHIRRARTQEGK